MTRPILAALGILLASSTHAVASLGSSTLNWAVPGVFNTGNHATVFQCSNPSTSVTYIMSVEVFNANGSLAGLANSFVPPGETRTMSTRPIAALSPGDYLDLGILTTTVLGSARVGPKQLICTAWVMHSTSTSPVSMNSLPIINRAKQRGQ